MSKIESMCLGLGILLCPACQLEIPKTDPGLPGMAGAPTMPGSGPTTDPVAPTCAPHPCPADTVAKVDVVGNPFCGRITCPVGTTMVVDAAGTKQCVPTPAPTPSGDPEPSPLPDPTTPCAPGSVQAIDALGNVTCAPEPPPTEPPPDPTVPPPTHAGGDPTPATHYQCPNPAQYSTNTEAYAFCTVSDIHLPVSPEAYCHWLQLGYIGFTWPESENADYMCPEGLQRGTNGEGTGFCILPIPELPKASDLAPWCEGLKDGTIAFRWTPGSA